MKVTIEYPTKPSLTTMSEKARNGFRARSKARRLEMKSRAEYAYTNLLADLGLSEVESNRKAVEGVEGAPVDAKPTASTTAALSALLYLVHRLEGDGLIGQARRVLGERRKEVEINRRKQSKHVISQRYLDKLAAIKDTPKTE